LLLEISLPVVIGINEISILVRIRGIIIMRDSVYGLSVVEVEKVFLNGTI